MFEHFTDHAKNVLRLEGTEAQRMHHAYLGTEHLLLALIREPEGHGHRALENLGIDLKTVRKALAEIVEEGPDTETPDAIHMTPRFKHVMKDAVEEARELNHSHIGTEHLLLALLCEPEGVAMKTLEAMNIKAKDVRNEVLRMLEEERACV